MNFRMVEMGELPIKGMVSIGQDVNTGNYWTIVGTPLGVKAVYPFKTYAQARTMYEQEIVRIMALRDCV